jgi:hypothetical protein
VPRLVPPTGASMKTPVVCGLVPRFSLDGPPLGGPSRIHGFELAIQFRKTPPITVGVPV